MSPAFNACWKVWWAQQVFWEQGELRCRKVGSDLLWHPLPLSTTSISLFLAEIVCPP